ncbi:hypothetical protein JHK85_019128 [Glycine max]|nr:hypothetical protein JHK85_019128 [Glycine max]
MWVGLTRFDNSSCVDHYISFIPPPGRSSTPKQTDAPASVARSLQNVMADVQGSLNATTLRSESYKTNGFEFQHEAESIASDTERVTFGSSSGEGI